VWLAIVVVLSLPACRSATTSLAPVPEAVHRLRFDIPLDDGAAREVLADALVATVCLLRGGLTEECGSTDFSVCNTRDPAKIRAAVQPFFDNVLELELTSSSAINADVRDTIPGAEPTRNVADARRNAACIEWRNEGACVAIKLDRAWFYLHAVPSEHGGRPDWLEVFLAEPVCGKSPKGEPGN
jgi:hypothetical protein